MSDVPAADPCASLPPSAGSPIRVLFLVRGLHLGGAERQLVLLAKGLRRVGHDVDVAVFYAGGHFEDDLRADGIPIHDLGKRTRWDGLPALLRLVRVVRSTRPDIVHAYMSLGNLYSATLKPLFPSLKVIWGIRTAITDLHAYEWATRITPALERAASPLADAIVANSSAARRQAVASGFDARKITVVPNGIDCDAFRPDPIGRATVRADWQVPANATLVGIVARLDAVKNHATVLHAFARVSSALPEVRFVCIGDGQPAYRERLDRLGSELGLGARLKWVRSCRTTRAVYSALDVSVLSSDPGESFPNVVGEAMACGVPCVVTDSGDAVDIVGGTGLVVPPRDPAALAAALVDLLGRLGESRAAMSFDARARIERLYSVDRLVTSTEAVLHDVRGVSRAGCARSAVTSSPGGHRAHPPPSTSRGP